MTESKVAHRYANSLLGLAMERSIADKINGDMQLVASTAKANRDLSLLLKNPIINSDKKGAIIKSLFTGKVDAVTSAFMDIIIRKGRENHLEEIANAYLSLYKVSKGIKTAYVTTAVPMDDELRSKVTAMVRNAKGQNAELIEKVDPSLIGGFILRIGDVQYDASVSKKLKALKSEFDSNLYIKEF